MEEQKLLELQTNEALQQKIDMYLNSTGNATRGVAKKVMGHENIGVKIQEESERERKIREQADALLRK